MGDARHGWLCRCCDDCCVCICSRKLRRRSDSHEYERALPLPRRSEALPTGDVAPNPARSESADEGEDSPPGDMGTYTGT